MFQGWTVALRDGSQDAHVVQFYQEPAFLVEAVACWAGHVLRRGGGSVLVGTPAHREATLLALEAEGLDVAALQRDHRLVLLDADGLMAQFMDGRHPSRELFARLAREAIDRARGGEPSREVRVWGEMVDLLCERGNPAGAMALEELWNEVLAAEGTRLLCSYRADPFDPTLYPARLHVYTHGHTLLLPVQDEAFFESVVELAMRQVCGDHAAAALRASLADREEDAPRVAMPDAQRLLAALHSVLPGFGRRVAASAKAYYPSP